MQRRIRSTLVAVAITLPLVAAAVASPFDLDAALSALVVRAVVRLARRAAARRHTSTR